MNKLKRVLYVEDEPDIQEITRMALETLGGLDLKVCSSGAEAIAVVEGFDPDLLLLDMMMPDLDGAQTAQKIHALPGMAALPVVLMTAKVQAQEMASYRDLGALGVITKPFDPLLLPDQLQGLWQGQGEAKANPLDNR